MSSGGGMSLQKFTPENTVIVFDLHGIIFSSSIRGIIKALWYCPHKLRACALLIHFTLVYKVASTILQAIIKKHVIEQVLNTLTKKYTPLAPFKESALAIANAQKINQEMVTILKKLHAQKYTLMAFSNIGQYSINLLSSRYPEIFNLFSQTIYTSAKDNYIAKPEIRAFDKLFMHVNPEEKHIIFVDDTFKNIQQAHALGIYTIPFLSATHLEQTFRHLKIL